MNTATPLTSTDNQEQSLIKPTVVSANPTTPSTPSTSTQDGEKGVPVPDPENVWDKLAPEWEKWIGDEGDWNRRLSSDLILWDWIKKCTAKINNNNNNSASSSSGVGLSGASQMKVLDAGCGTGYLAVKLAQQGFKVLGVDVSRAQLDHAEARVKKFQLQDNIKLVKSSVDSISDAEDGSMDLVISNYVLMDMENYKGALKEFHRALKVGGHAIVIFLHPCYDTPKLPQKLPDGTKIFTYAPIQHPHNYFNEFGFTLQWGDFSVPFVGFHRPLSEYFKAFIQTGFTLLDFEETGKGHYTVPCAAAFLLQK